MSSFYPIIIVMLNNNIITKSLPETVDYPGGFHRGFYMSDLPIYGSKLLKDKNHKVKV